MYTNGGNQAFMIKSNLGSGYVRNVVFDHFISRGTAYGLDVNQYWASQTPGSGAGVQLSNITFSVCSPPFSSSISSCSRAAYAELGRERRRRRGAPAHPAHLRGRRAVLGHHAHEREHVVADRQGGLQVRERVRLGFVVHQERLVAHELRDRHDVRDQAKRVHDPDDPRWRPRLGLRHERRDPYSVSVFAHVDDCV